MYNDYGCNKAYFSVQHSEGWQDRTRTHHSLMLDATQAMNRAYPVTVCPDQKNEPYISVVEAEKHFRVQFALPFRDVNRNRNGVLDATRTVFTVECGQPSANVTRDHNDPTGMVTLDEACPSLTNMAKCIDNICRFYHVSVSNPQQIIADEQLCRDASEAEVAISERGTEFHCRVEWLTARGISIDPIDYSSKCVKYYRNHCCDSSFFNHGGSAEVVSVHQRLAENPFPCCKDRFGVNKHGFRGITGKGPVSIAELDANGESPPSALRGSGTFGRVSATPSRY